MYHEAIAFGFEDLDPVEGQTHTHVSNAPCLTSSISPAEALIQRNVRLGQSYVHIAVSVLVDCKVELVVAPVRIL